MEISIFPSLLKSPALKELKSAPGIFWIMGSKKLPSVLFNNILILSPDPAMIISSKKVRGVTVFIL